MLFDQPSAVPNRKIMAVIIATFVVQGAVGVGEAFAPGLSDVLPAQGWIEGLAVILAGYFVREAA